MSNLHKSKRYDHIRDMFNDSPRYLDSIFNIDNPEFEKHIPDIYPTELKLKKANTSAKETSVLDFNIKVIGSDVHTSVYDKHDNVFVVLGRKVFQQVVGIPMGTNCAPLLADIFLYSYEAEFIQSLLSTGKKK